MNISLRVSDILRFSDITLSLKNGMTCQNLLFLFLFVSGNNSYLQRAASFRQTEHMHEPAIEKVLLDHELRCTFTSVSKSYPGIYLQDDDVILLSVSYTQIGNPNSESDADDVNNNTESDEGLFADTNIKQDAHICDLFGKFFWTHTPPCALNVDPQYCFSLPVKLKDYGYLYMQPAPYCLLKYVANAFFIFLIILKL